ncbi:MAG TPA: bifunctional sulfate adenylyltransferase/adenylylsulfate kinase [Vicinamibacteria bacterium]|nr:bifunctional sulfate adenylyltransferase/adenylylsulfate kinase [Vicinamibacteria bacterium]
MTDLIPPYGGTLCELLVPPEERPQALARAAALPSITLDDRQVCDLELLLNGGFSPLRGFMGRAACERVVAEMRLPSGEVWPIPITLAVPAEEGRRFAVGQEVALFGAEGVPLAILQLEEVWEPDLDAEARGVFGTEDDRHPGVAYLRQRRGSLYLGGRVLGLQLPDHYDSLSLRNTPAELRAQFRKLGWTSIVAFQTRNPMHRAHKELTVRAALKVGANLLIHPVVGLTKPGDVDHFTRVRVYQRLLPHYPHGTALLSLLPLAMRMGGPREAVWHAIIRRNYGCTHFIVGRDHAGPGADSTGRPFYGPYDAQELLAKHSAEIGITPVPFPNMVYVEDRAEFAPADEVPEGSRVLDLSGTELRRRLNLGLDLPEWFTYPEVAEELRRTHPPRSHQGFTVFFTGLSGAGKSTLANALQAALLEEGSRPVTLLDGDIVRTHLSSELGFSKEHRDLNIRRIAFVASEITKNGGVALCAPIAPYAEARRYARDLISARGGFIEVHVATPIETCESRDRKGLYRKARLGLVKGFTGIDDPYEVPEAPELRLDTSLLSVAEGVRTILNFVEQQGFLG